MLSRGYGVFGEYPWRISSSSLILPSMADTFSVVIHS